MNSPVCYDGNPHAATVDITAPSTPGTVSNVKYDGFGTVPSAAATYAVTANFVPTDSTNYNTLTAQSAGNFVIRTGLTRNSDSNGAWNTAGTWEEDAVPLSCDSVVIVNGSTVTLDSDETFGTGLSVTVNSGGTLNTGANTLSGSGSFTLASGGTLGIGDANGITDVSCGTGASCGSIRTTARTFNGGGSYTYNGASAQVTGDGLPVGINNLTINNSAGVSLSRFVTLAGTLTLTSGRLTLGSHTLTMGSGAAAIEPVGSFSASNMIVADDTGSLCKNLPISSYDYPIGDATAGADYSPVTAVSATGDGTGICFRVTDAAYSAIPTLPAPGLRPGSRATGPAQRLDPGRPSTTERPSTSWPATRITAHSPWTAKSGTAPPG